MGAAAIPIIAAVGSSVAGAGASAALAPKSAVATGNAGLSGLNNELSGSKDPAAVQAAVQKALNGSGGGLANIQELTDKIAAATDSIPSSASPYDAVTQQGLGLLNDQYVKTQGLQDNEMSRLNDLQTQGFNLQPQDQSLYGQESGDITRQFGQSGNELANQLAQRGMSNSGAAGAQFSGLQGTKNEQLSQAQQQIAQTRFQNTMGQIQNSQNFLKQLDPIGAASSVANFGMGAEQGKAGLMAQAAGAGNNANANANSATLASNKYSQDYAPVTPFDYVNAGAGKAIQKGAQGLFTPTPTKTDPVPTPSNSI